MNKDQGSEIGHLQTQIAKKGHELQMVELLLRGRLGLPAIPSQESKYLCPCQSSEALSEMHVFYCVNTSR